MRGGLSTGSFPIFWVGTGYFFVKCEKKRTLSEKQLTFWQGHAKVAAIGKKAETKTVRQVGFSESRRLVQDDSLMSQGPSLPSRSAEWIPSGSPVCPR